METKKLRQYLFYSTMQSLVIFLEQDADCTQHLPKSNIIIGGRKEKSRLFMETANGIKRMYQG
jgi:hypothetical protein